MRQIKNGDLVVVDYEGRLKNGEAFETTAEAGPLQFTVGKESVLPAFEQALLGMKNGETKIIEIPTENAYGPKVAELVQSFDRKVFGEGIDPRPGMVLGMTMEQDGEPKRLPGYVTEADGSRVTIDFNHPLAGQTLLYRITVKAVNEAPARQGGCIPMAGSSCSSSDCSSCN